MKKYIVPLTWANGHECIPRHNKWRDADVLLITLYLADRCIPIAISSWFHLHAGRPVSHSVRSYLHAPRTPGSPGSSKGSMERTNVSRIHAALERLQIVTFLEHFVRHALRRRKGRPLKFRERRHALAIAEIGPDNAASLANRVSRLVNAILERAARGLS